MCPLAPGATARSGISLSFFKNIFTVEALKRPDLQPFLLRGDCFLHMDQVLDNLFFSDADGLWKIPGAHFDFGQKRDDSLASGLLIFIPHYILSHLHRPPHTKPCMTCRTDKNDIARVSALFNVKGHMKPVGIPTSGAFIDFTFRLDRLDAFFGPHFHDAHILLSMNDRFIISTSLFIPSKCILRMGFKPLAIFQSIERWSWLFFSGIGQIWVRLPALICIKKQ